MKALDDLDNMAFVLSEFSNYYGSLTVFKKGSEYSMSVGSWDGHCLEPIPGYLYEALLKFAKDTIEDTDIFDLSTEEGRKDFESTY